MCVASIQASDRSEVLENERYMRHYSNAVFAGALALGTMLPALSAADKVDLRRDDVVPVVFQSELRFSQAREGDVFRAEVVDSRMLPRGSRIEGVVNRVVQKEGKRKAFMDIEFTTIILPDGHKARFHGTPISLDKDFVTQDRYGRWEAKKGVKKETVVLGAMAGGLVLGAMINKPFEGTFLGAIVGVIAAETDKEHVSDGDVVVPKGSKVGARVDDEVSIDFDGRWDNLGAEDRDFGPYDRNGYNKEGFDRYGYDKEGKYDAKYDCVHGSRDDDRGTYNKDGYDKYGYDRDGRYNPRYDSTRGSREHNRGDYNADGYDKSGHDRDGHYNPRYDTSSRPVGGGDIRIEIDKTAMRYDDKEQPYRKDWIIMVPLRSTAEQLGYHVGEDSSPNSYRIENDDNVLVVEQDSRSYSLNHRRGTLPAQVEVRDGVAYVPIDTFTMLTKGNVTINGTKYRRQA